MRGPAARVADHAQATDVGLARPRNEDRLLVRPPLFAVADGVGGAAGGERAAQLVVDALAALPEDPETGAVIAALAAANARVLAEAAAGPRAGMGSTVAVALVREGHADIVHVGDSRVHLLRDGELRRLTEDHSLVEELRRSGAISDDEAARHPRRNVITRAVGAESELRPTADSVEVRSGDVLLLCTDGLSAQVDEPDILAVLRAAAGLEPAATALVAAANAAGGADNVTVVLARVA